MYVISALLTFALALSWAAKRNKRVLAKAILSLARSMDPSNIYIAGRAARRD